MLVERGCEAPAAKTCKDTVCPDGELCSETQEGPTCYKPYVPPVMPPVVEPTCPECLEGFVCTDPKIGCVKKGPEGPLPPVSECTLGTPTAREAKAQGKNPTLNVQREGAKRVSATPVADFGYEYYCSIGWAEACAEKRRRGPVAPDGHPQREVCEAHFLETECPVFREAVCTGTGPQCPMTFDTWFVINGVNQPHPRNLKCDSRFDVKDADGHLLISSFWTAIFSGKGKAAACNADGSVCGVGPEMEN